MTVVSVIEVIRDGGLRDGFCHHSFQKVDLHDLYLTSGTVATPQISHLLP